MQELLNLRVRACEIVHWKVPFVGTFRNPLLVKEILFTNCSKEIVDGLLRTCIDLEKIVVLTTFLSDKFFDLTEDHSGKLSRLKKLKEIEVGIQVFKSRGEAKSSVFETFFANPVLVFPSLRRICIHYPMSPREWVHCFQFICRHAGTLKALKLLCVECPVMMPEIPSSIVGQLNKVNLSTLELICNCNNSEFSPVHTTFANLISSQRSLHTLTLDFQKCPLHVIKDVIRNCQETLQCVKLSKVEFGLVEDLQGSMFRDCVRLRELKLHCLPRVMVYISLDIDQDHQVSSSKPLAKGAETFGWILPKSLRRFSVKGCHVPTEELIDITSEIEGCNKIRQLELYEIGTSESYGYGLTFNAFLKLCENLEELELLNFRCVSYSAPETEALENLKWAALLEAGKVTGVYTEPPFNTSSETMFRCDSDHDNSYPDLTQFFSFSFRNSGQRLKFLKMVHEQ